MTKNLFYCLMTLCLIGTTKSLAQNSIINGSFNAAAANWTFFAPGTTTEAYNPETSYGGTVGTNTVAEIDNQANLRQVNIPVTAGVEQGLSFRHTRRTGNGAAPNPSVFIVKVYDGSTTYINQTITSSNATWNWQCKYFTFTPTGTTVSIDFENVTATTLGSIVDDITIAPTAQTVSLVGLGCQGGSIQLQAPNFPGDPNSNYTNHTWTGPGGITGAGSSLSLTNLQTTHDGTYTCTMLLNGCFPVTASYQLTVTSNVFNRTASICQGDTYNFYGRLLNQTGFYDTLIAGGGTQCDSLIKLNLTVLPSPKAQIKPFPSVNICPGEEAVLQVVEATAGATYQWYRNAGVITGANNPIYRASTSGYYHVVATMNGCTTFSDSTIVTLYPRPQATIVFTDEILCTKDTMAFAVAQPNAAYVYTWEPKYAFSSTGGYEGPNVNGILDYLDNKIILNISDDNGCRGSDSVFVPTISCCDMMLPNAFTPNGDGKNDYFKPFLDVGQSVMTFEVFDRYGAVVFGNYAGNSNKGWDGCYKDGKPAALGVYMYYLRYLCSDGKIYTRKGEITLIR